MRQHGPFLMHAGHPAIPGVKILRLLQCHVCHVPCAPASRESVSSHRYHTHHTQDRHCVWVCPFWLSHLFVSAVPVCPSALPAARASCFSQDIFGDIILLALDPFLPPPRISSHVAAAHIAPNLLLRPEGRCYRALRGRLVLRFCDLCMASPRPVRGGSPARSALQKRHSRGASRCCGWGIDTRDMETLEELQ